MTHPALCEALRLPPKLKANCLKSIRLAHSLARRRGFAAEVGLPPLRERIVLPLFVERSRLDDCEACPHWGVRRLGKSCSDAPRCLHSAAQSRCIGGAGQNANPHDPAAACPLPDGWKPYHPPEIQPTP